MRVIHVIDKDFPPSPDHGGAPQLVASLAKAQRQSGNDVLVVTSGSAEGSDVSHFDLSQLAANQLVAMARRYGADVVHFHAFADTLQPAFTAHGIPTVCHVHGDHYGKQLGIDNAIYVSRAHAERHGGEVFVHNGLDLNEQVFVSEPDDYLVFLGKVRRSKKGADTAVSVARATQQRLWLIGGRKLSIPSTWLPINRYVRAAGVLKGPEKNNLLAGAKALLFPIRWDEPFGLVLIEAMASGVPVIAFDRGAVSEVICHGESGFIVDNFVDMCRAVEQLPTIDRQACRRHVAEHFSIASTVSRLNDCYSRAIAGETW